MSNKNTGNGIIPILTSTDFNSLLMLGGVSVAIIGGFVYYFLTKTESDEKVTEWKDSDLMEEDTKTQVTII